MLAAFVQLDSLFQMAIQKNEFYEGAALHQLARGSDTLRIRHDPPFFVVNDTLLIYLKYSTKGRSPWGFTFGREEQALLVTRANDCPIVIGLICGADGIAAVEFDWYRCIAAPRKCAVHISCARKHGHHYQVAGPDGTLDRKVSPSLWQRMLLD